MAIDFKPAGCQQVVPYLILNHPEKTIDFVKKVFDATEAHISRDPQGRIMHASMKIGDSVVMMGAAGERWPAMPAMIYVYVPDVETAYKRALVAGATSMREPETQFYGDRSSGVIDDQGVQWWIGTQVEVVGEEELQRRTKAAFAQASR